MNQFNVVGNKIVTLWSKGCLKVAPALVTYWSAIRFASLGIKNKNSGKGQQGGFLITQDKVEQMIKHKNLLTMTKRKKMSALLTGGQVIIKLTDQTTFQIVKNKTALVKWWGYSDKINSWVKLSDLNKLQN